MSAELARVDVLAERLCAASALTRDLLTDILAVACPRLAERERRGEAARLDRLIAAGAYTDAALALVEIGLPKWQLYRLVFEDGEWLCSLSRHPLLADALDETAEARHPMVPLAIARAFLEACRLTHVTDTPCVGTTLLSRPSPDYVVCPDNFA